MTATTASTNQTAGPIPGTDPRARRERRPDPATIPAAEMGNPLRALPFWLSLGLVPVVVLAVAQGGWTIALIPLCAWGLFSLFDLIGGEDAANGDPATPEAGLRWYRAITLLWGPVQLALLCWMLWRVPGAAHLGAAEKLALFLGMGVVSGTIGINYSHELMHRPGRAERWLADLLLASVLYSHFRSEHLRVHHVHVATPRDAATARYNEGFHRFFPRVLRQSARSAWAAERAFLARCGRPVWNRRNPFWRYALLQTAALGVAAGLAGPAGLGLFVLQAAVAVWQLELINYIEHYGLTRRPLAGGRYEPVLPQHSWNAHHRASNWLLLNLARHSDHHLRPDRPFALLQSHAAQDAPRLPCGYPAMAALAMVPPAWRRVMNPRVRAWRRQHYPDITDWSVAPSDPPPAAPPAPAPAQPQTG